MLDILLTDVLSVDVSMTKLELVEFDGSVELYKQSRDKFFESNHLYPNDTNGSTTLMFLEIDKKAGTRNWLFVKGVKRDNNEIVDVGEPYQGRLVVGFNPTGHRTDYKLSTQKERVIVRKVLDRDYGDIAFEDYSVTRLKFKMLQKIIESDASGWREALSCVCAIYLITDTKYGGAYVGSAYGQYGLLGRWSDYAHGKFEGNGNDLGLIERMQGNPQYAEAFEFSILEVFSKKSDFKEVIRRENWWKDTLRTRTSMGNRGMNKA